MDAVLVFILAFVAGYWTHSPRFGAVAGMLVALGGGVLRDLWLGIPLWVLEHPQYILLAAMVGFLASHIHIPLPQKLLGSFLLILDFGASVVFGILGGHRAYAFTHSLEAVALASVLTASGGGFLAGLIGKLGLKE